MKNTLSKITPGMILRIVLWLAVYICFILNWGKPAQITEGLTSTIIIGCLLVYKLIENEIKPVKPNHDTPDISKQSLIYRLASSLYTYMVLFVLAILVLDYATHHYAELLANTLGLSLMLVAILIRRDGPFDPDLLRK